MKKLTSNFAIVMKNRLLTFSIIALSIFIIINNFIFIPANILSWDVFGYYLYLPFKFIYNDLGLNHISIVNGVIGKYHNTVSFYQATQMPDGHYVMKYSMGMSFFYAPFFFIAHLIAKVFNYTADGFSAPYQYAVWIGSIIYTLIGIWALSKVLAHFFTHKIVILVLFIIVFSTNFFIHNTMYGQNAMSHNYLFMTYALIIWLTILWHQSFKLKYVVLLGIICGVSILSRPSEIVCLIIPAMWGVGNKNSLVEKLSLLFKYKKQMIVFGVILIVFGLCQLIYWKIYTGKFLFNSYGGNAGEGFEFFHPFISKVLFSFRNGWLIYTPVMMVAIIGFYFIYQQNRSIFYALFIYCILNLYIVSSWSCWWYGQSFSQRALIPSYPVMAIGFGYFLTWLGQQKIILKFITYVFLVGCVMLNLFQIKQIHYSVLSSDRMTREYYFRVFGRMTVTEEDKKTLLINRSFDGSENFNAPQEYDSKPLQKLDFENAAKKDSTYAYSGRYSFKLDSTNIYSPHIAYPYFKITNKDHAWIKVTAYVYSTKDMADNPFSLVVHFTHKDYPYKYKTYDSEKMKIEPCKWNKIVFYYLTPEVRRENDKLMVYVWLRGKGTLYVDDLQVDVYEKKT